MFKAIDSRERLSFKIHPRYFTFRCCLISLPLYTIFKDLALPSLCLVPYKIDFVLSCLKCILNLLSTNQSHKLEKPLIGCFSVSVTLLCWNTIQVLYGMVWYGMVWYGMVWYGMVWYGMSLPLLTQAQNQSFAFSFDLLKVLIALS